MRVGGTLVHIQESSLGCSGLKTHSDVVDGGEFHASKLQKGIPKVADVAGIWENKGKRRKPEISPTAGDALLLQTLLRISTDPWKEDSTFPSLPPQGGLHARSDAEHWPQSYLRFSVCLITTQQAGCWWGFNTDLLSKASALLHTHTSDI